MQIDYELQDKQISVINFFEDELFTRLNDYNFGEIQQDVLEDTLKNSDEFLDRVIELVYFKLGLDFNEFILNLKNHSEDTDIVSINYLIENQLRHVKLLLIDFLFKQLPFNYILKMAKNGLTPWNIDNLNIRELLIEQLQIEIEKTHNINDTTEIIKDSLSSITQLEQFNNIKNKLNNRSNKIIIENKLLIGIIDEISSDNLKQIFKDILNNEMIQLNIL